MSSLDLHDGGPNTRADGVHDSTPFIDRIVIPDSVQTSMGKKGPALNEGADMTRLVIYFMTIHFLLAYCELILVAPLIKLYEQSLCIRYYDVHNLSVTGPSGNVLELSCKIPEIQTSLATIRGWKSMFDTIPVLLVAIPFGGLADRYGRRKLMAICLLSVACSFIEVFVVCAFPHIFPLQLVWLSSIVLLCGGGLFSAAALMWAMAAEAFPEKNRSQAFYFIFAAFYVAELVGSSTAAVTTDISPWISCGLSMAAIFLCVLLLWAMPYSERVFCPSPDDHQNQASHPDENTILITTKTSAQILSAHDICTILLDRNILLAIPVFLTGSLRFTILNVLIQYASNRFNLKISTGAFFYSETAIVNMLLFLLVVPISCSFVRTRYHVRPQAVDLFMSRTCISLLCLGSLFLGLAPSAVYLSIGVVVFAAGFGSRVSTLSLISYWISDDSKATLYAVIAVIENIGHAVGDPGLQQVFATTLRLRWSPFWQALPFFVATGLYCLAGISTIFINIGDYASDPST